MRCSQSLCRERACRASGGFRRRTSNRRKTMRRLSPFATWNARESTLSQTAKFAARATRTGLQPRLRASMLTNPRSSCHVRARATPVPRVVGKVRRARPIELRDMEFLRRNTDRVAKITLPGAFTMSEQAKNEFYSDEDEL